MKWFKHISTSLDDPFISDLLTAYRSDGYLVFFGILEIYSREFKPDSCWKLTISWNYLRKKCRISAKNIRKILQFIQNSGKWDIMFYDDVVDIRILKFLDLLDETTLRKFKEKQKPNRDLIGIQSGFNPAIDKDKDKDIDIESNKNIRPGSKTGPPDPPVPKPDKRVYSDQDPEMILAKWHWTIIIRAFPKTKEPDLQKWADSYRMILDLDKRDLKDVRAVLDYMADNLDWFWTGQIRSPGSMRGLTKAGADKFPVILSSMADDQKKKEPADTRFTKLTKRNLQAGENWLNESNNKIETMGVIA